MNGKRYQIWLQACYVFVWCIWICRRFFSKFQNGCYNIRITIIWETTFLLYFNTCIFFNEKKKLKFEKKYENFQNFFINSAHHKIISFVYNQNLPPFMFLFEQETCYWWKRADQNQIWKFCFLVNKIFLCDVTLVLQSCLNMCGYYIGIACRMMNIFKTNAKLLD